MAAASGDKGVTGNTGGGANGRRQKQNGKAESEIRWLNEEEANRIVADAYKEAARIMEEARRKAESIGHLAVDSGTDDYPESGGLRPADETGEIYERLDELFARIRSQLEKVAVNDQVTAGGLMDLVNQLEYYVDSLVVDSLKLRNMRYWLQGTTALARRLKARLDRR